MGKNKNLSKFRGLDAASHPVECVSWTDAVSFCEKLSNLPKEKRQGHKYRLPTEEEWEYACRAGAKTDYSFGNDPAKLGEHAWFRGNAEDKTHKVGTRTANPWGLHDMHGNVREWCADYFDKNYNPNSPLAASVAAFRVLRGGSYNDDANACRSTSRRNSLENFNTGAEFGFRVVLELEERRP
jgi:formylglycine-generating enzyme required for sulfatase activity